MTNLNCCTYLIWMLQLFFHCVAFSGFRDASARATIRGYCVRVCRRFLTHQPPGRRVTSEEEISGFYFIARLHTTVIWMVRPHRIASAHTHAHEWPCIFCRTRSINLFSFSFYIFSLSRSVRSRHGPVFRMSSHFPSVVRHKINPHTVRARSHIQST